MGPDVPENNVVLAGEGDWGDVANSASVDGHGLTVDVSYAGGCRRHVFYGPGPGRVALRVEGLPREDLVYDFAG